MPELPEVETIKLQLKKYLIGLKINDVEIRYGKKFEGDPKDVEGGKIKNVRRFGKALSIDLDNGNSILIHIKMTGQLIYRNKSQVKRDEPEKEDFTLSKKVIGGLGGKHTHIIFHLDRSGKLYFNDVRKFGWIKIVQSAKLKVQSDFIRKLGPEPDVTGDLDKDKILTVEKFKDILSGSGRAVKLVIMDQEKIGGVGNIYANDALWLAKVNPKTPANKLQSNKVAELYEAIHKVLKDGLKYGGASELSYVTPDGSEGKYQDHTLAYGHEGEICKKPACRQAGAKIEKFFLSGRGTYWCPSCQSS